MVSFGDFFFYHPYTKKYNLFKLILWSVFAYIERVNHVFFFCNSFNFIYVFF